MQPNVDKLMYKYWALKKHTQPKKIQTEKMEDMFAEDNMEEDFMLPGFRFHPTDEELVGFYLRRKVGRKPLCFEFIRDVDIYKHDPWDLPKLSVGDKEWYFFCVRGRKYRNSTRPNRVTKSGFWKATGIDKLIYSSGQTHECIGLKKSLVFYRGAAGKGTKTDWMMHEFRLPPSGKNANQFNPRNISCEAEVWTLCRIFKKIESYKRYKSEWENTSKAERYANTISSKSCSLDSEDSSLEQKIMIMHMNSKFHFPASEHPSAAQTPYSSSSVTHGDLTGSEFFKDTGKWDELGSVVDLASDRSKYTSWS